MKVLSYKDPAFVLAVEKMKRRAVPTDALRDSVAIIIKEVADHGDKALIAFTQKFDGVTLQPNELFVTQHEFAEAAETVSDSTRRAIKATLANIHAFAQKSQRKDWNRKNAQGAWVGERFTPFDRVGVYVPGGKAPLVSTALMTAGFAQAVGVPQIIAASPAGADGKINPALLFALQSAGVTEVLKVGGAHAIAALALGTNTVKPVDRIFGPGNRFVVEAKRQLVGAVSIDLLPGPSEILILADRSGNADCIAADILAQAEHGGDSLVGFLTDSKALLSKVMKAVDRQSRLLTRSTIIEEVLKKGTFLYHVKSLEQGMQLVNDFAPEHLSLIVEEESRWLDQVRTAGAIYLGNASPVAVGDFLAGPSHTLPTGGAGRSFSGLRADQFQRRTSIVKMDVAAVKKSVPFTDEFARIEGLDAHGRSVSIRLDTDL
jgi:histidinol dehydrogenase